jgi:sirohydrochlorin cobaltochelatase
MKTAIMLIAHGARESEGKDCLTQNSARLKEITGLETYGGYLHIQPSIGETAEKMVGDGIERIIAIPLFIFPGYLTDVTVRKSLGIEPGSSEGRFECGGRSAEVIFTGTFGDHPLMESVITDVCAKYNSSPADTTVMLIFHGNKNGAGKEYVDRCVGYLSDRGYTVMAAYNEFQEPTVEKAAETLIAEGKNVLAIPMFVSPGSHTVSDIPPKLGLDGSDVRSIGNGRTLRYAQEIGMHPGITEILRARLGEVLDLQ